MDFYSLLGTACALASAAIGGLVLIWGSRSLAYRIFSVSMILLAVEQGLYVYVSQLYSPLGAILWGNTQAVVTGLLPVAWLLFSLCFSQVDYKKNISRSKWILLLLLASPAILPFACHEHFYMTATIIDQGIGWSFSLGWAGMLFHVFFLLACTLVSINLEKIIRASSGIIQWRIKFMVLGMIGMQAARIYTSSQALLYSSVHTYVESVNAGASLIACLLFAASFFRTRMSDINIYFSQTLLYNSITVFVVAVYLIVVGVFVEVLKHFGGNVAFPWEAVFIFVALIGLAVFLFSSEVRQRTKFWINRHLGRPNYDYKKIWTLFSRQTASLLDRKVFCGTATKIVADILGTPAVTIWLLDDKKEMVSLGGSTMHSMTDERSFMIEGTVFQDLANSFRNAVAPAVIDPLSRVKKGEETEGKSEERPSKLPRSWCCIPLEAVGNTVGFMTLSERDNGIPYSTEDLDLIKTIADQTSNALLNLKISEQLRDAKQLETFQTVSAFFVHDLKNLASTLSLTVKNLPVHFDNPEFREDALRIISNSVDKINDMCGQLSSLKNNLDLNLEETDLRDLVDRTVSNIDGFADGVLHTDLQNLPQVEIDPDQIQKIVVNFVINAGEAIGGDGKIIVETRFKNDWAEVSVSDNGCGMTEEFMENSLFRPFQTTKKKGLGIGLFQCRKIAEAHRGKIDVESKKGEGSTFRLLLPVEGKRKGDRKFNVTVVN